MIFEGPYRRERHDRRQSNRAGANDGDDVAGLHLAVLHANLETGRQDVREQDALGVGQVSSGIL